MHYTEGDGRTEPTPGKYEFVDFSEAPPTPGTIDTAEYNNAVMYEILNVLDYAGVTPETTAALDRTAGWVQLKEAIFESAAITDAAISDVSIDKLTDGDTVVVGSTLTNRVAASPTPSIYTYSSSTLYKVESESTGYRTLMANNGFDSGGNGLNVAFTPDGINFSGASHPTDDNTIEYNKYVHDRTGTSWIVGNGGWNLLGTITALPDTVDIISASVKYTSVGGSDFISPASLSYSTSGGFWQVNLHVQNGGTSSIYEPTGNVRIYFEIDGNTL